MRRRVLGARDRRLAESNRVIVPDVPGLGESDPVARLDDVAFAGWFGELIRATCQEPPTLIAHSLLGSVAARFAVAHGGLLRRLVVYAAPGVGPYRMPLGLRVVAVRFGLRPTARNAERFDRWAFYDFDRARRRTRSGWTRSAPTRDSVRRSRTSSGPCGT